MNIEDIEPVKSADSSDTASNVEESERREALLRQQNNREKPPQDWDGKTCVEVTCGLDIESIRIQHGFFRCFECQSTREDKIKRFGGVK